MSEYISAEGLEKLKQELHDLKTSKRREIAGRLEHAKTLGDLSENAEYQEVIEEQKMVEQKIGELEEMLRNIVVIKDARSGDVVVVGSTVRVKSPWGEEVYRIVGSEESDPGQGKISNESPLGKAFLGRKKMESVEVRTPRGSVRYEIVEIK
ncbi:MAG: transcription elongation factor GreA [Patescibacteria group bacterium]